MLAYFDNDVHWNQFHTTPDRTTELLIYLILMVTGTNLVPQTVEHALEVPSHFDNDGHWDQFGSTSESAIELLTYFDKGGHWIGTNLVPQYRIAKLS